MLLHKLHRSTVVRISSTYLLVVAFLPRPASAEPLWKCAKDYTASINQAVEDGFRKLGEAFDALQQALEILGPIRAEFEAAGRPATGPVATAFASAAAAAAAAEATVAAAIEAVGVAVAVMAAFYAGTLAGQGLDWLISKVVDPIAPIELSNPVYHYPTDAEVDDWLPDLLQVGLNRPLTRAFFDYVDTVNPGAGTICWTFLRENTRGFAIGIRDGGAYTAHRCPDVMTASADLEAFLPPYMAATSNFASLLSQTPTFVGDPVAAIDHAMMELANLEATVIQYPEHHPNPPEMLAAINYMRYALMQCRAPFYLIGDPTGKPIAVDGGLVPPYTLVEFLAFLTACHNNGRVCLPQAEIAMTDRLMIRLGATYAGLPSIADQIAEWDGEGDTGNEALLFAPFGQLTRAQVLLTAIGNHWQLIQLSDSALVLGCPRGDVNCDGTIDFFDIDPFLTALFNPAGYEAAYPDCNIGTADANQDSAIDFFDIDPFLACLFSGCP